MATAGAQLSRAAARLAETARESGLPRASLERFLSAGYVPQPKQLEFHAAARECDKENGPTRIGFGGARGPGKSHAALAQVALDDCQRVPGLKFLFLRRVLKAAKESFDDLRRKVLMGIGHDYKRQEGVLHVQNEGRIILGHYQNESDIDAYLGLEYDGVVVEEATQLTLAKRRDISTCVRTSKPGWRPREYDTTNPGGVGHAWFKNDFIVPAQRGKETDTRFIFATYLDNKFLDSEYVNKLNRLTGWKLRAWRDGDWDIAAGQFFSTWRHDAIVKASLEVIKGQPAWCALDYGFTHPTVCQLFTEHDGRMQIIDEHWRQKALVTENADEIKAMLSRHGLDLHSLRAFVAGPDVFAKRGNESGKTIADEYADEGIYLTSANTDRINGAARILKLLGDVERGIEPTLEISDRCTRLIECLPSLQHDPHRPEDVLKVNVDEDGNGGDDSYDTSRYGLMESTGLQIF